MKRSHSMPLQQAAQQSPVLAALMALAEESGQRLAAIKPLIPPALQSQIAPGPIDGTQWCLLVNNSAAAAKLRQLLPTLLAALNRRGWEVTSIRLKLQTGAG